MINGARLVDHLWSVGLVLNVSEGTIAERIDYNKFGVVIQNASPIEWMRI